MAREQVSGSLQPTSNRSLSPVTAVPPSAAGTTVRGLRRALEEIVGVNVVAAALNKVPPPIREEFDPLTPMTWVPLTTVNTVIEQVAAEAHASMDELYDDAVRRAAEQMFRTSWRLLLRITTDSALVARTPVLYSKWRNIGYLESHHIGPGHSEILLGGWPGISERNVRTLGVAIETVLRLAGRRAVKIEWTRNADGAKFKANWRR